MYGRKIKKQGEEQRPPRGPSGEPMLKINASRWAEVKKTLPARVRPEKRYEDALSKFKGKETGRLW